MAGSIASPSTSESVVTKILGTQAIAAAGGHNLVAVGFSWQDERESDATTVMETLTELGFRNLRAVSALELPTRWQRRSRPPPSSTRSWSASSSRRPCSSAFSRRVTRPNRIPERSTAGGSRRRRLSSCRGSGHKLSAFVVLGSDPATDSGRTITGRGGDVFGDHDSGRELALARGAAFAAARPTAPIGETSGTDRPARRVRHPNHTARRDVGIA